MFYRYCLALVLAALVVAAPAFAQETPYEPTSRDVILKVGKASVVLPPPAGFEEVSRTAPQLAQMGRQMTAQSNRFVALYMPAGFVERLQRGEMADLNRYMSVQTIRATEKMVYEGSAIAELFSTVRREMTTSLTTQNFDQGGVAVQRQGAAGAIFDETPYSISAIHTVNFNATVGGENRAGQMVTATTFAIIKGKVLNIVVFTPYTSPRDLQWAKDTTTAWVRDIAQVNERPLAPVAGLGQMPGARENVAAPDSAAMTDQAATPEPEVEPVDISWVFYLIFAIVAGGIILILLLNHMLASRRDDKDVL